MVKLIQRSNIRQGSKVTSNANKHILIKNSSNLCFKNLEGLKFKVFSLFYIYNSYLNISEQTFIHGFFLFTELNNNVTF